MTDLDRFLDRHGLYADSIDTEAVLADFASEMERGLAGEASSLKMIPTFMTVDSELPVGEPVIVIDAGGTNLRIAVIRFGDNGEVVFDSLVKHQMPGVEKELSAEEFFSTFADYLQDVIGASSEIGFCFSYPAEISADRDGKLVHWTKDIKAPEVIGKYIGRGLLASLGKSGEGKNVAVLNDTIATLLAGKAKSGNKDYESYIGFILGTGTNLAYIEKNSNITKRDDLDSSGAQAINVESGNFNLAPRGDIDKALDESTMDPGVHVFEKMLSGLYRGELVLRTLKAAVEEGFFSEPCADYFSALGDLEGKHVDQFLEGKDDGPLTNDSISPDDKEILNGIIDGIYLRTAKLTAISISAGVLKSGAGSDPSRPVCINIDGSTYYKSVGFKDMVESYLSDILEDRGITYELIHVDEAPLIGAAVAGLAD